MDNPTEYFCPFHFDSNYCWGYIETRDDWNKLKETWKKEKANDNQDILDCKCDREYINFEISKNGAEIKPRPEDKNGRPDTLSFGTRMEHVGENKITLRMFFKILNIKP